MARITSRYYEKSVKGIGLSEFMAGTGWGIAGTFRRRYAQACRKVGAARNMAVRCQIELDRPAEFAAGRTPEELALAIPASVTAMALAVVLVVEGAFGGSLGWQLGGGDNPLLGGWAYLWPALNAVGFAGVFALAGYLIAEAGGKVIGRWASREDAASLKPTASDLGADNKGSYSKRRVVVLTVQSVLIIAVVVLLWEANMLRETNLSTASVKVSPERAAALGVVLPLALMMVKGFWFSREAAVEFHHLQQAAWKALRRYAPVKKKALGAVGHTVSLQHRIIAAAALADFTQEGASTEEKVTEYFTHFPIPEVPELKVPADLTGSRSALRRAA